MKYDYIKLENTFNRVLSAMKSVADKETVSDLNQISYVIAEVRCAAQMNDDGSHFADTEMRLMRSLILGVGA